MIAAALFKKKIWSLFCLYQIASSGEVEGNEGIERDRE